MIRRLLVLLCAIAFSLVCAAPVSANGAGAVTSTQTFHNATMSFPPGPPNGVNPCTGALGTLTLTFNGVMHFTVLTSGVGAGTGWATFTATGGFTFQQLDGVTFTGKFTAWDGENFNLNNFAATGILVGRGTGSDGSTLNFHDVMHITLLGNPPTNAVVAFDKLTCG